MRLSGSGWGHVAPPAALAWPLQCPRSPRAPPPRLPGVGVGPAPGTQDSWAESITQVASWACKILTGSESLRESQFGLYHPLPPPTAELTAWTRERKRGHRLSLLLLAGERKEGLRTQVTLAYSGPEGNLLSPSKVQLWANLHYLVPHYHLK